MLARMSLIPDGCALLLSVDVVTSRDVASGVVVLVSLTVAAVACLCVSLSFLSAVRTGHTINRDHRRELSFQDTGFDRFASIPKDHCSLDITLMITDQSRSRGLHFKRKPLLVRLRWTKFVLYSVHEVTIKNVIIRPRRQTSSWNQ